MGDLVPISNSSLIVKDPEQEAQLQEDRIKEARGMLCHQSTKRKTMLIR